MVRKQRPSHEMLLQHYDYASLIAIGNVLGNNPIEEEYAMHSEIVKVFGELSIAHQLPHHDGKCRNLHGHNYNVQASFAGKVIETHDSPEEGMVIDFSVVKDIYKQYVDALVDHAMIIGTEEMTWYARFVELEANEIESNYEGDLGEATREQFMGWARNGVDEQLGKVAHLPIRVTTAELLSYWIFKQLEKGLAIQAPNIKVTAVWLWETATGMAQYRPDSDVEDEDSDGD